MNATEMDEAPTLEVTTSGPPLEYSAFALCFKLKGSISLFAEQLPPEHVGAFLNGTGLRIFYQALLDFHRKTGLDPIDPIAFASWLDTETEIYSTLGGAGGVRSFLQVLDAADATTPDAVVAVLKHRATKRQQIQFLQELQLLVTKKEQTSDAEQLRVAFLTDQIRALENEVGYDPLEGVTTGENIAHRADHMWELPDFLPTQFPSLNRALGYDEVKGGFVKGAIHAILAPSGKGKSTFSRCLMNHWVAAGHTVLYVNYEEAVAHWERILFTQVTGCNVYASDALPPSEKQSITKRFRSTMESWGERFIVRHDPDTPYFEDLERWLRDILGHNERLPDVVIIDTIQSMFTKGGSGKPRWGQYEEMMVRLEKLAKDMHAVFVLTAQENTNRMKERREVVQQSDAGGSITILQKASVGIFLTEKRLASDDDSIDENIVQLQIPKNRIAGNRFANDPPLVRYHDDTKTFYPYEPAAADDYDDDTVVNIRDFHD